MTPAQFRIDFPEFADPSKYPDSLITYWLAVAANLVNLTQWGNLSNLAQELVTAHFVVLAARDQATASAQGIPGVVSGPQTAKAVGSISASYDTAASTLMGGASWNMTSYGIRFINLSRLIGAGGLQFPQSCE